MHVPPSTGNATCSCSDFVITEVSDDNCDGDALTITMTAVGSSVGGVLLGAILGALVAYCIIKCKSISIRYFTGMSSSHCYLLTSDEMSPAFPQVAKETRLMIVYIWN